MADRLLVAAALPSADALARALDGARHAGYPRPEVFSPHPLAELRGDGLGRGFGWALVVALLVAGAALLVQYYAAVGAYPMNVSGKPVDAWAPLTPAAVVVGLMAAGIWALVALFRDAGLPRLHHPVFDTSRVDFGADRWYVLAIEVKESELPRFRSWLEGLGVEEIEVIRP